MLSLISCERSISLTVKSVTSKFIIACDWMGCYHGSTHHNHKKKTMSLGLVIDLINQINLNICFSTMCKLFQSCTWNYYTVLKKVILTSNINDSCYMSCLESRQSCANTICFNFMNTCCSLPASYDSRCAAVKLAVNLIVKSTRRHTAMRLWHWSELCLLTRNYLCLQQLTWSVCRFCFVQCVYLLGS